MKIHEFFSEYANLPIEKRGVALNVAENGLETMTDLYRQLESLEDVLLPYHIKRDELLRRAEEGFRLLTLNE